MDYTYLTSYQMTPRQIAAIYENLKINRTALHRMLWCLEAMHMTGCKRFWKSDLSRFVEQMDSSEFDYGRIDHTLIKLNDADLLQDPRHRLTEMGMNIFIQKSLVHYIANASSRNESWATKHIMDLTLDDQIAIRNFDLIAIRDPKKHRSRKIEWEPFLDALRVFSIYKTKFQQPPATCAEAVGLITSQLTSELPHKSQSKHLKTIWRKLGPELCQSVPGLRGDMTFNQKLSAFLGKQYHPS